MLPVLTFEVNGRERDLCYVDGIYPNWTIFVETILEATMRKHNAFAAAQEAFRKDVVERTFQVL